VKLKQKERKGEKVRKMRKIVLVVLAVLSIGLLVGASQSVAASGEVVWEKTFDGGDIIIGEDNENRSIWIIKRDRNRTEQVNYTFNGSAGNYGEPFCQTSDGGRITVNSPQRPSYGSRYTTVRPRDIQLIKEGADRTEEWRKIFRNTSGGTPEDMHKVGKSVIQTSDHGYIIVGYKIAFGCSSNYSDFADLWVIKVDKDGIEQWDKTFATDLHDSGRLIIQTSDGGYIVVGIANSAGNCNAKLWLIKIDANGTEEWNKKFWGSGVPFGESIHQTSDGYIITGSTIYPKGRGHIDWLIKIDANGTEEWKKTFGRLKPPPPNQIFAPAPETSGFEAIFAIAGLLAIAYLIRQRK
jgi:hypothetical protein